MRKKKAELRPRNGHLLIVYIVCRISGCQRQKEQSLEDQEDNAKEKIADLYDGPVEYRVISTKGKGEQLCRPELAEIEAAYRSRKVDLFVFDDLSRLIRGTGAKELLGIGVDNGTRSVCIADGIDTADDTWEEDAIDACGENVAHQNRTSKRIKQKTMNRFVKNGETTDRGNAGYIVPKGSHSYDQWLKDESWTEVIREGAKLLKSTLNGEAAAEYLNRAGFRPGRLARKKLWNGTMVLRFYRNPILKGLPWRGRMETHKRHGSGKRPSKKNPDGPNYYPAPHLAHLDPVEFDELEVLLARKNCGYGRKVVEGLDPRSGVPKKRTRALGQHAQCWYCGRKYVWGANGIKNGLMCSGSRERLCWNSIGVDGPRAATRIVDTIIDRLKSIDGLGEQFRDLLRAANHDVNDSHDRKANLRRRREALEREKMNVGDAIAQAGPHEVLLAKLTDLHDADKLLQAEERAFTSAAERSLEIPSSTGELFTLLHTEITTYNIASFEFAELFRQLVPECHIYLVRLLDGGHLMPRAKIRLNLSGSLQDADFVPGLRELLSEEFTLDLFEPPERERIREESVRLSAEGFLQREIAAKLPKPSTQTAVWKAIRLHRQMLTQGLSVPWTIVHEPPSDYSKLRRHCNSKYRFEPLEGYQRPPL